MLPILVFLFEHPLYTSYRGTHYASRNASTSLGPPRVFLVLRNSQTPGTKTTICVEAPSYSLLSPNPNGKTKIDAGPVVARSVLRMCSSGLPSQYSPPEVDGIWGIWGSHYYIPKAIFYLINRDYKHLPEDVRRDTSAPST